MSSWTLSLAFGLKQRALKKSIDNELLEPLKIQIGPKSNVAFDAGEAVVAYLIDWRDDRATRLLATLLKRDIKVRVAKKPFKISGDATQTEFGYGTLSVPLGVQPAKRKGIVSILSKAASSGVAVTAVRTGLNPTGIDLGSGNNPVVKKPSVAMLTGSSVSAYGAGEIWHLFDTRLGMPLSMIKASAFSRAKSLMSIRPLYCRAVATVP